MVKDLRLTEAIKFSVETEFTWTTIPPAITSKSDIRVCAVFCVFSCTGHPVLGVPLHVASHLTGSMSWLEQPK